MWRVLVFLALLLAAAFGAVWIAERPGSVAVEWGGYRAQTTAAIAAVLVAGAALALVLVLVLARWIMGMPTRIVRRSVESRHRRGLRELSRGMIAVGAGDATAARRHAAEAQRLLGKEPLALLLRAQAAQIAGDRPAAEDAFRAMLAEADTRVLGLRGLYVEARRLGNRDAAQGFAAEAARLAPTVPWANDAILEGQCAQGDWAGALATLERRSSLGLIERDAAKRQRAVLLTADALSRAETDGAGALAAAQEAVRLAPDLAPAAALAGRLLADRGDLRRASRVLEAAWKAEPHPDLAAVYLHARPGDSAHDRMKRAETLARLSSWAPEGRLALARAAAEAREFDLARRTVAPLLEERPHVRTCLLMAEIERAEGAQGRAREWLARAAHAPRGPAWVADGLVSDRWSPISPVSGRLDAFVWETPPELISGAGASVVDDALLDLDDRTDDPVAIPPPPAEEIVVAPAPAPEPPPAPAAAEPAPHAAAPAEPVAAAPPVAEPSAVEPPPAEPAAEPPPRSGTVTVSNAHKRNGRTNGHAAPPSDDVVFPLGHPPDDPGPKADKPPRRRFFG